MLFIFDPDACVENPATERSWAYRTEEPDYFIREAQAKMLGLDALEALFSLRHEYWCTMDKGFSDEASERRKQGRVELMTKSEAQKEWAIAALQEVFGKKRKLEDIASLMEDRRFFKKSKERFLRILDREFKECPAMTIFRRCRQRLIGRVITSIDTQR